MCIRATVLLLCVSCLSLLMPLFKIDLRICVNNAGAIMLPSHWGHKVVVLYYCSVERAAVEIEPQVPQMRKLLI